jgi:hypothetical protein
VCSDSYRSELEKYIEDGILTRLYVSFSRDKKKEKTPKYVQVNSMFLFLHYSAVICLRLTTILVLDAVMSVSSLLLQCIDNVNTIYSP